MRKLLLVLPSNFCVFFLAMLTRKNKAAHAKAWRPLFPYAPWQTAPRPCGIHALRRFHYQSSAHADTAFQRKVRMNCTIVLGTKQVASASEQRSCAKLWGKRATIVPQRGLMWAIASY